MIKKLPKVLTCLLIAVFMLACVPYLTACNDEKHSVKFKVAASISTYVDFNVVYKSAGSIEVKDGECIGSDAPDPTYAGGQTFEFAGWYTEKELINKWDIYKDEVRSDMTLYAKYIKK